MHKWTAISAELDRQIVTHREPSVQLRRIFGRHSLRGWRSLFKYSRPHEATRGAAKHAPMRATGLIWAKVKCASDPRTQFSDC
jgi:hypothetical protein